MKFTYWLVIGVVLSCAKSNDYTKYQETGEIRYAAKPEALKAFSGNERIKLQWKILSDQNINKAKIYWRNKSDSLEVPIVRSSGIDTISVTIPLKEGAYSFDVVHYHEDGVRSLASNISSTSYGPSYVSTLMNRTLISHSWTPANQGIVMNWGSSESTSIGTRVNYININNDPREFVVGVKTNSSTYTRLLQHSVLEYRTLYKPDTLCIDTFYSPINTLKVNY
jgi:hypothetical protein